MALLGKFVDITTGRTFAAGSGIAGPIYQTVAHSLGVVPDDVRAQIVSVGAGTLPPPQVEGIGGNTIVSTFMLVASTLGNSDVAWNAVSRSFMSLVK